MRILFAHLSGLLYCAAPAGRLVQQVQDGRHVAGQSLLQAGQLPGGEKSSCVFLREFDSNVMEKGEKSSMGNVFLVTVIFRKRELSIKSINKNLFFQFNWKTCSFP